MIWKYIILHFDYFKSHLIGKKLHKYGQPIITITTYPSLSICSEGRSSLSIFYRENQHQFLNTLQWHLTEKIGYKTKCISSLKTFYIRKSNNCCHFQPSDRGQCNAVMRQQSGADRTLHSRERKVRTNRAPTCRDRSPTRRTEDPSHLLPTHAQLKPLVPTIQQIPHHTNAN